MLKNLNKKLLAILLLSLGVKVFISCYGFLFQIFFVDDAFYYFKIARNITSGLGITYDGIQHTTGFQPLFLILIIPFFLLGKNSIILPLHLVAVFLSFLSLGIGFFLYKISKTVVDEWYALFIVAIWSLSPIVVDKELNGMETGLNLFLIAATTYYYVSNIVNRLSDLQLKRILFLGIMIALVILSRLDGLIFLGIIVIHLSYHIIKEFGSMGWFTKLVKSVLPLIGLVLIFVVPWLVFNYKVSGSVIPTSGQAVRYISLNYGFDFFNFRFGVNQPSFSPHDIPMQYYLENIFFSFMKLLRHLPYTSYVARVFYDILRASEGHILLAKGLTRILSSIVMLALFSILWKLSPRSNRAWNILFFYSIFLISAYCFYAFGQWFYHRYYFTVAFMGTIWGGRVLFSIDSKLKKRLTVRRVFKMLIVIIFAVLYLLQWRQVFSQLHRNQSLNLYRMVKVVEWKIPKGAIIGCLQSGILGYYSNRKVINLDGVVNQEALIAMKGNRLGEYVAREGITYIMDWPYVLNTLFFTHLGDCESIKEITPIHKRFFHIYKINYN